VKTDSAKAEKEALSNSVAKSKILIMKMALRDLLDSPL
jgi:hypothetical protein